MVRASVIYTKKVSLCFTYRLTFSWDYRYGTSADKLI